MINYDFFGYYLSEEGEYIITKNGEYFLTCTGSEAEAKNIVETMRKDVDRIADSADPV